MTDVPDTGLVEAFRPLKTGGGGSQERPTCANCPCGSKDMVGSQGVLVCTRWPPEMNMTVKQTVGGLVNVPQVGFKPVHDKMVCWEHPVMQARMHRAVAAALARSGGPAQVRGFGGPVYDPLQPVQAASFAPGIEPQIPEPAAVAEADGRKPGDDP
jgi:hypothetical protein